MKFFLVMVAVVVFLGVGCASPETYQSEVIVDFDDSADDEVVIFAVEDPVLSENIVLESPAAGSTVTSPLVVEGEARGFWFFEASFPVVLKDVTGATISSGIATASGDWMTEEFVPFSVTLSFPLQAEGSVGTLTLVRDNPSGLPENAEWLDIPVVF